MKMGEVSPIKWSSKPEIVVLARPLCNYWQLSIAYAQTCQDYDTYEATNYGTRRETTSTSARVDTRVLGPPTDYLLRFVA
jgi:hypothetical protein